MQKPCRAERGRPAAVWLNVLRMSRGIGDFIFRVNVFPVVFFAFGIFICVCRGHRLFILSVIDIVSGDNIHGFLYHSVLYRFEFEVVDKRNSFRKFVRIGSDDFFTLTVPEIIQGRDALIAGKFIYDIVYYCFDIGFQITVLLFAACHGETVRKLKQSVFDNRVVADAAVDLRYDPGDQVAALRTKRVTMLCLLFINEVQVIRKDILREGGAKIRDSFLREIRL